MSDRFDTEMLLNCYRQGVFPMADSRDDMNLFLISPERRGILPLKGFHIPRRLKRTVRRDPFRVTVDLAFNRVIEACAAEVKFQSSSPAQIGINLSADGEAVWSLEGQCGNTHAL